VTLWIDPWSDRSTSSLSIKEMECELRGIEAVTSFLLRPSSLTTPTLVRATAPVVDADRHIAGVLAGSGHSS
jgi:hypothetical protein